MKDVNFDRKESMDRYMNEMMSKMMVKLKKEMNSIVMDKIIMDMKKIKLKNRYQQMMAALMREMKVKRMKDNIDSVDINVGVRDMKYPKIDNIQDNINNNNHNLDANINIDGGVPDNNYSTMSLSDED